MGEEEALQCVLLHAPSWRGCRGADLLACEYDALLCGARIDNVGSGLGDEAI